MTTAMPLLEARHLLVLRGGVPVLEVDRLLLAPGEILALIGPNGAGKTTLLQALAGLLKPQRGQIILHGLSIEGRNNLAYRRRVAMVFQEPLLLDTSVAGNVAAGLKLRGVPAAERKAVVAVQLAHFGIVHLAERSARTLSGGEAQRTSLARALAVSPEILFLDEPFSALDPPTRSQLIEDLRRALRETGTTAVMTTHDREEALQLCDRVAVMQEGRIVQLGAPEAVMNQPANEFVAAFVGMETILKGRVAAASGAGSFMLRLPAASGQPAPLVELMGAVPSGEEVIGLIRPEHVTVSPVTAEHLCTSARNVFAGRITRISQLGLCYKLGLDCGFPLAAYVTPHALQQLELREGSPVIASFKATAVQVVRHGKPGTPDLG